jgi:hypothetical protein
MARRLARAGKRTKIELRQRKFVKEVVIKESFRQKTQVIMTKKAPIKVIKRDERNRSEQSTKKSKTTRESAQGTAREMVQTVTNWVNEFQQKRRTETTQAIKTLFPEPPQPSEA